MIFTAEELCGLIKEAELIPDSTILLWLDSIENVIRTYCHNSFQNPKIRFEAESINGNLMGNSPYIQPGDTVQISHSGVNDGLYLVTLTWTGLTELNKDLYDVPLNRITKVEYPSGIKEAALDLFKWKMNFGDKIGIKSESETLSRHSQTITYEDNNSLYMGYPKSILGSLNLWKKARRC